MTTRLCFIDTETTGLNPFVHQAYEVAYAFGTRAEVMAHMLPHTLDNADPFALEIGHYFDRGFFPNADRGVLQSVRTELRGVTLVGSNPAFDAAFLTKTLGVAVWHHRLINVADAAMWIFNWDRPRGLADIAVELRSRGYGIGEPDHTAAGDVRVTQDVYWALRDERNAL